MLIKRIQCTVTHAQKHVFFEAQKQWHILSKVDGFCGQTGGWYEEDPLSAVIYAFWESADYYNDFMKHVHDEIFANAKQVQTFTKINVTLYECSSLNLHHILRATFLHEQEGIAATADNIRLQPLKETDRALTLSFDQHAHGTITLEEAWQVYKKESTV
ncbi:antibiotic biosynthesis monooxygenase [Fictibacillus macauensis ZFHKF-1]|uniref:Antibiotic biosynthesis monooxygenase n=1 Tax=Fictibacillus macauensis ZFHKF-1 TaxID=1196324 RepID=I8AEE8_9BACL|nr:DUF4937 domain-containing protein [Fictibacillus macauensis]EIT83699.1 antibiotic biosynthesis monooxygenase [Fictibacillus macauensis ZFHKF-1]